MPYVAPSTVTAGQTYTASAHNIIVEDVIDHEARINSIEYPFRNLLINGAMQIAQRATSVTGISSTVASNTFPTVDRWQQYTNVAGTHTNALSADAPAGSGFRNSMRVTCTTAITSLSASSQLLYEQRLEGQTLQHIKKGTASAQQLTLSFWVKGSTTGTYIARLLDVDNSRAVSGSYTISAANTWEQKTITFPADTTGVLDNDNAHSLSAQFWLVAGSTFTSGSLQTTWGANSNANIALGQTNLAAAVNNYWQITGVQLEIGSYATDYGFLPYENDLERCQRYYFKMTPDAIGYTYGSGFADSTTVGRVFVNFPTNMRVKPTTLDVSATAADYGLRIQGATIVNCNSAVTIGSGSETPNGAVLIFNVASGLTAGGGLNGRASATTAILGFNSEL